MKQKQQQTEYPKAWPGSERSSVMPQDELDKLRCSFPECDHTWRSPGGLARAGGNGEWRCADHRLVLDHASHRLDLRQATQRAIDIAVIEERERIIRLLDSHPPVQVYQMLIAQRPKQPDAPPPVAVPAGD